MEVGLQQFHVGDLTEGEQLKKLQQSCQDGCSILSKSAISMVNSLRLDSNNIQYVLLCHLGNTPVYSRSLPNFNSEDKPPTVTCICSYCNIPQPPSIQQQIWFRNVDSEQVCTMTFVTVY